jgi:hypothetical protein
MHNEFEQIAFYNKFQNMKEKEQINHKHNVICYDTTLILHYLGHE